MLRPVFPKSRHAFRNKTCAAFAIGALLSAVTILHVGVTGQLPLLHRENVWSIAIYEGATPFDLHPGQQSPSLTAADVTDVPALFVADPFLIKHDKAWHMFFEVLDQRTNQGDIGLAVQQRDGRWDYQQIVVDEPFHLSYPQVFTWQDQIYMIPESEAIDEVRLYRATQFPLRWELVKTLIRRDRIADPTVCRWHDRWWMFAGRSLTHDELWLFHADDLTGPWQEHPKSPVISSNANVARPGGRVFELDGQLFRLGQDCLPRYGNQLRAFRITSLTRDDYAEHAVAGNPILAAQSTAWNNAGMHHCDLHRVRGGGWMAAVDGHTKKWIWRFRLPN